MSTSPRDPGKTENHPTEEPAVENRDSEKAREATPEPAAESLYFFPEDTVSESQLREILSGNDAERRAWAISHLLRYAQWDDIWTYTSRDEVRDIFATLDLPETLRNAWGRMLKVEAPVG